MRYLHTLDTEQLDALVATPELQDEEDIEPSRIPTLDAILDSVVPIFHSKNFI